MDQVRVLDACRRDRARLVLAYRLGRIEPGAVELWPEDAPEPPASQGAAPFEASPWLDHELFGLLPLGWHAATNERGAVRLYSEPQPGELLIEAGNLIERMAAGKEAAPVGWGRSSQERRSDVLARRRTVEPDAARQTSAARDVAAGEAAVRGRAGRAERALMPTTTRGRGGAARGCQQSARWGNAAPRAMRPACQAPPTGPATAASRSRPPGGQRPARCETPPSP